MYQWTTSFLAGQCCSTYGPGLDDTIDAPPPPPQHPALHLLALWKLHNRDHFLVSLRLISLCLASKECGVISNRVLLSGYDGQPRVCAMLVVSGASLLIFKCIQRYLPPPLSSQSGSPFSLTFSSWICTPCGVPFQRTQLGPRAQNSSFVFLLPQPQAKFVQCQMWKGYKRHGDSCDQLSFLQSGCLDCSTSSRERVYIPRQQDFVGAGSILPCSSLGTCGPLLPLRPAYSYTQEPWGPWHINLCFCGHVLGRTCDWTEWTKSQGNPAPLLPQCNWLWWAKPQDASSLVGEHHNCEASIFHVHLPQSY